MTQNLAGQGYAEAEVIEALESSNRRLSFSYEWLASDNSTKGYLTNVAPGGTVTYSTLASIKRTLSLTMYAASDPGFDFMADRVRPIVSVLMPDGGSVSFPQGVFLLSAPEKQYADGLVSYACTGYDQAQVLVDDTVTTRYVVTAGTAYTDAIAALLFGLPNVNLVPSELTLPIDRAFDPGTTKLEIVNALLTAINYTSLWFDGYGYAQVQPYIEPDYAPVGYTYTNVGNRSLFTPEASSTAEVFSVPNYIVFTVSQPGRAVLTSSFINQDPTSPVSTVSRGRKIVKTDTSIDVATQVELDALVRRAALNAANIYQTVTFSTPLMPIHENRDVLSIVHSGLDLSGKFAETEWKLTLKEGSLMTHSVRQVINLNASLVGSPDVTT